MPKKAGEGEGKKENPEKLACRADFSGVLFFLGGFEGAGSVRQKPQKYRNKHKNASQNASKGRPSGAGCVRQPPQKDTNKKERPGGAILARSGRFGVRGQPIWFER